MADITTTITLDTNTIVVQPVEHVIDFKPVDIKLDVYSTGRLSNLIPSFGVDGALQYNNGGYMNGASTVTYDDSLFLLSLGGPQNMTISGGVSGEVLSTDGNGVISWTHTVANAGYALLANNSNYSNVANLANVATLANTANVANLATVANTANVANLATYATTANGVNAAIANTKITGGTSGQYLKTDGAGGLSWGTITIPTSGVTQVIAGPGIGVTNGGVGVVTITNTTAPSAGQVNRVLAGTGVTISSTGPNGTGTVTVNSGGGVIWENPQTITANYTIGSSNNAMSVGNVRIGDAVTVTVPVGSVWIII